MYILLANVDLRVLHKHKSPAALVYVGEIEAWDLDTIIFDYSVQGALKPLTDYELSLLYKKLTNETCRIGSRDILESVILNRLNALPESLICIKEAANQLAHVKTNKLTGYRYVYGSNFPAEASAIFDDLALRIDRDINEETLALTGGELPFKAKLKSSEKYKQPTLKSIILEYADNVWCSKGRPCDLRELGTLKAKIIKELWASKKIKETTSRSVIKGWVTKKANYKEPTI